MSKRQLNVTELDFDQIKQNLIDHFKAEGSPYRDWDFEGSGLNLLLNLLSYNTHYNAILAHSAMNESFLDTAQLRNNVVARAKALGYVPRSKKSARARVRATFNRSPNATVDEFSIPVGTTFRTRIDDESYTFITREVYTSTVNSNNKFVMTGENEFDQEIGIQIFEGSLKTLSYQVNSRELRQKFIIEDENADIDTLRVRVFENDSTSNFEEYNIFNEFAGVTDRTPIYFVYENVDGLYEVVFGDGVFGKRPSNMSRVEIEYISTSGQFANKANIFEYVSALPSRDVRGSVLVETLNIAEGGGEKESIESIRDNAPLTYISQNRAVTAEDYRSLLKSKFAYQDISVWGGQDNDPPEYGKVFISIFNGENGEVDNAEVLDFIRTKKIVTVIPEIRDIELTYLFFNIFASYDPDRVRGGAGEIRSLILNYLPIFEQDNLAGFDRKFRFSVFLNGIDRIGPEITNSFADVRLMKVVNLTDSLSNQTQFSFNRPLTFNTERKTWIWSQRFVDKSSGRSVSIETKPEDEDTRSDAVKTRVRNLWLVRPDPANVNEKLYSDNPVGEVNLDTGRVTFSDLVADYPPTQEFLQVEFYAEPSVKNVVATKNEVLQISSRLTKITPRVDSTLQQTSL